jgi:hypothetical protein
MTTTLYRTGKGHYKSREEIELDEIRAELQKQDSETRKIRDEAAQMMAESAREAGYLQILRAEFSSKLLRDTEANRQEVFSLWDELQGLDRSLLGTHASFGAEWFAAVMKSNPKLANRFSWTTRPDPNEKKLQERARRDVFHDLMVELGLSESHANWNLFPKDLLDNAYTAKQAIVSGAVRGLMQATPSEIAEREAIRVDRENLRLLNSDVPTLKKLAREEAEQPRVAIAKADADRILKEKEQIEAGQFEPLPATTHDGRTIDKKFFLRCDPKTMGYYISRYGDANVTARIRGIR